MHPHTHTLTHTYIQRIRRISSGRKCDADTQAILISCFDVRRVKLVFILDTQTSNPQNQSGGRLMSGLENSELGQKLTQLACLAVRGGQDHHQQHIHHHNGISSGSDNPGTGRRLLKLASDKVQGWKNSFPDRVTHLKMAGKSDKGLHRYSTEVRVHCYRYM